MTKHKRINTHTHTTENQQCTRTVNEFNNNTTLITGQTNANRSLIANALYAKPFVNRQQQLERIQYDPPPEMAPLVQSAHSDSTVTSRMAYANTS